VDGGSPKASGPAEETTAGLGLISSLLQPRLQAGEALEKVGGGREEIAGGWREALRPPLLFFPLSTAAGG